jgi:hypothetical protein
MPPFEIEKERGHCVLSSVQLNSFWQNEARHDIILWGVHENIYFSYYNLVFISKLDLILKESGFRHLGSLYFESAFMERK